MNLKIRKMIDESPDRRNFVKKLGFAAAALSATPAIHAQQQTITDLDIAQFALNLEYLEAEFYTAATTGQNISQNGLTITGTGASGPTTGGAQVNFTDTAVRDLALELAANERAHVKLLRDTITSVGATPVAKPAINLGALGIGFGNQNDFLVVARALEDIGVSAYLGAAPLIQNKTILDYAARILAVEAMHAGAIRDQVVRLKVPVTALDTVDHVPPPSGTLIFNTNDQGLAEARSPGEVLRLAYAGNNVGTGGFFPSGLNGAIATSATGSPAPTGNSIVADPNPIPVSTGSLGQTTISWSAASATKVEVRLGSPTGVLFTNGGPKGSAQTGVWVPDNLTVYLMDVSNGGAGTVLASVVIRHRRP